MDQLSHELKQFETYKTQLSDLEKMEKVLIAFKFSDL